MNPYILEKTKDLNNDNIHQKVGELLAEVTNHLSTLQVDLLFIYHNTIFPKQTEHTKSCAACRGRVFNRVKEWYDKNNN